MSGAISGSSPNFNVSQTRNTTPTTQQPATSSTPKPNDTPITLSPISSFDIRSIQSSTDSPNRFNFDLNSGSSSDRDSFKIDGSRFEEKPLKDRIEEKIDALPTPLKILGGAAYVGGSVATGNSFHLGGSFKF